MQAFRAYDIIASVLVLLGSIYFGWFTPLSKESWQTFSKNLFVQLIVLAYGIGQVWLISENEPLSAKSFAFTGVITLGVAAFTVPAIRQVVKRYQTKKTVKVLEDQRVSAARSRAQNF
jgi:TRAP-type C4-dicarboxylate transport system permease small subunit